jgi:hypothetical protein
MKLKLVAAISALVAIPALAHAQQGGPQPNVPKPTNADVQNVVQIVTTDKAKTQAYCDLTKLYVQIQTAEQRDDSNTIQTLGKQADALVDKLGPEYFKMSSILNHIRSVDRAAKKFGRDLIPDAHGQHGRMLNCRQLPAAPP